MRTGLSHVDGPTTFVDVNKTLDGIYLSRITNDHVEL